MLRHWYPPQDSTSRLADLYGERADGRTGKAVSAAPVVYASTPEEREAAFAALTARQDSAMCERVDAFMAQLRDTAPIQHLCVEAKHRRVIGTLRVGTRRGKNGRWVPMRDSDLAEVCIKGPMSSMGKRVAFSRALALAYQGLLKALDS
jgi:uncharacterized protein with PIN domain